MGRIRNLLMSGLMSVVTSLMGMLLMIMLTGLVGCDAPKICTQDGECTAPLVCQDKKCQPLPATSCSADRDCPQTTPRCDAAARQCVRCLVASDCAQGQVCKEKRCIVEGATPCQKHDDCIGSVFPYCSTESTCSWKCRVNGDCKGSEACIEHVCRNSTGNKFCITHNDCASEAKKYCSTQGDCSWECLEASHCVAGQVCKDNACRNEGCTSDTDCTDGAKPICNKATGKCEAKPPTGCQSNADCNDSAKPVCNKSSGQCEAKPTTCSSDANCQTPTPKCDTSGGKCVACLADADCKDTSAPVCTNNTCVPKQATGCGSACPSGQFCFEASRCIDQPKECQTDDDCSAGNACVDAGARSLCFPACDPTQNASDEDLTNPACWNNYGWCYSLSDTDPKEGACFPPQLEKRLHKETCNDDANPDKPEFHTCKSGLTCIEITTTEKRCWINCDPAKNVGGDPDVEDKNPDCDGGKGSCSPLGDGDGACDPDSSTPTPQGQAPKPGELVINELLADPPADAAGDANKDGTRHSTEDEFVELVNTTTKTLLLDDVTLTEQSASNKVHFTFPQGTQLAAGQAVVIFGGGMSADADVDTGKPHPMFGGALVYVATSGVGLSNAGKVMELKDAQGTSLNTFTYGAAGCEGDKDQSVTRSPDGTGSCKLHTDADPNMTAFSPGTKADGSKF